MTTDRTSRADRVVVGLFDELAMARTPDYLEAAIEHASSRRQRPAWTFPERWIPMADIASRPAFVPRLPSRAVGMALILIALLIALAIAVVGSRQPKLPAPFGPAGNGLIAYSKDGNIFTLDPVTGVSNAVVTGPDTDLDPEFSRDGTRLLFARQDPASCCAAYLLAVAAADGTDVRILPAKLTTDDSTQFTPDGRGIIVGSSDGTITRFEVDGRSTPVVLGVGRFMTGEIRPPDGAQLLFEPDSTPEIDLWIMDADGANKRPILPASALAGGQYDLAVVRWSPDGSKVAFTCATETKLDGSHICVMDADGSDIRMIGDVTDDWFETDLVWSPDSQWIAFNRWQQNATGVAIQPIGLVSVDGGPVTSLGAAPDPDGALFDWSPDGKSLLSIPARLLGSPLGETPARPLSIDPRTGEQQELAWEVSSNVSWQRVAP